MFLFKTWIELCFLNQKNIWETSFSNLPEVNYFVSKAIDVQNANIGFLRYFILSSKNLSMSQETSESSDVNEVVNDIDRLEVPLLISEISDA